MSEITELNRKPDIGGDVISAVSVGADSATVGSLEANTELGNPTYPTLADVPTTLSKGAQVYVQDEDRIYVEDGT